MAHKGMRFQTARGIVVEAVKAEIARRSKELSTAGSFLQFLQQLEPEGSTRAVGITHIAPTAGFSRSGKPAPGSIPDRVLDIVSEHDEPVTMSQILAGQHGAKEHSVMLAVRALVRTGNLVAIGQTSKRRYALPDCSFVSPTASLPSRCQYEDSGGKNL